MATNPYLKIFLNLIFPIDCAGCGREDSWLCQDCLSSLPFRQEKECFFCGRYSPPGSTCQTCAAGHSLDGVFVCGDYNNKVIASLIKKLKYSFAAELDETLGEIAGLFLKKLSAEERAAFDQKNFSILPIPLHKKRFNWRGFNQAEKIAVYFAAKNNLKIGTGLIRVKHKTPQAGLSGAARKENIKNCFAWNGENLNKSNILLIDDVATTGSTLDEAAGILKIAGAGQVWGLVIAKG